MDSYCSNLFKEKRQILEDIISAGATNAPNLHAKASLNANFMSHFPIYHVKGPCLVLVIE
jgi:hypothetical protein